MITSASSSSGKKLCRTVIITVNGHKVSLPTQNIIYIYAQLRKIHIVTTKGKITTGDTFGFVHSQLKDSPDFCEPHRSYLVNLRYVQSHERNIIFCSYGNKIYEVYLSRRKRDYFKKKFIEWVGGRFED